jgi:hypothetical protein
MKTTIELSDALFEQAKVAAKEQGTTLKALVENGLRWAIAPKPAQVREWPDLTFIPATPGHLIEPSEWREHANPDAESLGWKPTA